MNGGFDVSRRDEIVLDCFCRGHVRDPSREGRRRLRHRLGVLVMMGMLVGAARTATGTDALVVVLRRLWELRGRCFAWSFGKQRRIDPG